MDVGIESRDDMEEGTDWRASLLGTKNHVAVLLIGQSDHELIAGPGGVDETDRRSERGGLRHSRLGRDRACR